MYKRQVDKVIEIQKTVSIPVMAKCRIGHFVEAEILASLGVDFIDESEVLTPADEEHHVEKHQFDVPFVCGALNLGEALRRISEGAALIRSKGEAGTGDVVEAVRHLRLIHSQIRKVIHAPEEELTAIAKHLRAPVEQLHAVREAKGLPVPIFAAGGVATPADAALMMKLGAQTVFVGSGIFKSKDPATMAKAMVRAVTDYQDPSKLAEISRGVGKAMPGRSASALPEGEKLAGRGW